MAARLHELNARRQEIQGSLAEILKAAATDKRPLKADEVAQADALQTELDLVRATEKHETNRLAAERGEVASPAAPAARKTDDIVGFGEFLQGVAEFYKTGKADDRLMQGAASGANTSVPSEGGVLVRTDYSTQLLDRAVEASQLLPKCTRITIGEDSDSLELPYIDETSRANGSRWGGVQVYRRAEADTVTATKPKFGKLEIRLEDLMGLAYATDRTLKDARALAQVITKAFSSEFAFKVDDEIFRGTGVGQMTGIYPGGALGPAVVQQAKGAAAADTVIAENVQKMFARVPPRLLAGAEWFIGNEVWPQLFAMNQANMPIFMPGISLANAPYGMLLGRPIHAIEQASAIGDLGDISFLNLSEFLVIEKGGLETAESIHVRFINGENTFRFMYRINGAPAWKAVQTPYKGAFTLSPFVGLEAR